MLILILNFKKLTLRGGGAKRGKRRVSVPRHTHIPRMIGTHVCVWAGGWVGGWVGVYVWVGGWVGGWV